MKYAVEVGSGAVIHVPSFTKIDSDIEKLMGGRDTQTNRQQGDRINLLYLFKIRK
jgi:hypothetical protein